MKAKQRKRVTDEAKIGCHKCFLLNPRILFTSARSTLSTTKPTSILSANPISPKFMLIQEISNSNNESQHNKESQEQLTDKDGFNPLA